MRREGVEVGAKGGHVYEHVRGGLSAVHQNDGTGGMCHIGNAAHGIDRAQDVGYVANGDKTYTTLAQDGGHCIKVQRPIGTNAGGADFQPVTLGCQLPRNDIRVVFHNSHEDLIAGR